VAESGDQAAGLRRLFGREQSRIVTFAAGSVGVGKSLLVANLAAALAQLGKQVLVLDETAKNCVAAYYGARVPYDLQHVIDRRKSLAEVLVTAAPGVRILAAARAVNKLGRLSERQQQAFCESVTGMSDPVDVILVNASLDHPLGFSPLGLAAHDTVIVIAPTGASITEAYALIKKVSLGYARKHFRVVLNKVRGVSEAHAIHGNIAELTQSRDLARLAYAGFVPLDEQLRQATRLSQPVVRLFPGAPAARAYQTIAGDLLNWPVSGDDCGGLEQFVQQLLHLSQRIDPIAIYA
jgi:flagellar biosynthesis protein FlhG